MSLAWPVSVTASSLQLSKRQLEENQFTWCVVVCKIRNTVWWGLYSILKAIMMSCALNGEHLPVHYQWGGTYYHCKPFMGQYRLLSLSFFVYPCALRRRDKTLLNGATLQTECYCAQNLFSLKSTALHSATPPAYKHHGTSALWEFTSNQFIFICFCWATSEHCSHLTAPAAFPEPALLHHISSLSMAVFFLILHPLRLSSLSLTMFIFIACIKAQLSRTWFKCISVGIRAQKLLQASVWLIEAMMAR